MNFWYSPLGLIVPIILQPIPIAIYRFLILKEPVSKKKANIISTVYTIATCTFIAAISKEQAVFHTLAYFCLIIYNYSLLSGGNFRKSEARYLKYLKNKSNLMIFIGVFSSAVLWLVDAKNMAHLFLRLAVPFVLLLFILFKNKEIEEDIEADRKWQEKSERERLERKNKNNVDS